MLICIAKTKKRIVPEREEVDDEELPPQRFCDLVKGRLISVSYIYVCVVCTLSFFQPPAPRLLILGPRGSGKSFYGRYLAKKFGLFHIQFQERLQELVIAKTKKRIVPEREEVDDEELPPLE